ncbi:MAG: CBS domain-containing protein [gamma proteobacterium symbiont of Bathyaustriella thionipta]|nr:CBS domain-containing protein [gamma proteobacterium symbiont of Bathyaustriella thionipta]MCU7948927.1 CBS domain-containing protein [gamma proteobacterium symbiont of Bathyaustriella thionipta]MCU7954316.1 CBS domain-containing protein [gamma proteobacterium symbiont of Bathyaustriella thionipta]MCU7955634.1 CBS domain-containing protein [gamma proteobacterium symbiont of Bathyaustriella thionipta]MCU7966632.1 CBS domain-containing protein [gamma proteobacterium symbiont of Bathyaustriella
MPCNYQVLEIKSLQVAANLCNPSHYPQEKVKLEDPAIKIMTDLTTINAVTISPSCNLNEATDRMLRLKVKLLFVTDSKDKIIGLITYSDIQGERPIQFQQSNGVPRSEVCVLDIMTGIENIDVLDWKAVKKARVGDIAITMKQLNRQHALVLEQPSEDIYQIRGIFSISLLSKLLGLHMDTTEVAKTFSEFERVLGCNT